MPRKIQKIGDPPLRETVKLTSEMDVETMTAPQLLAKIRVATGRFAMAICEQKAWSEEDVEQLGRCARILVPIARLEATAIVGKGAADMTDDELGGVQ
jgi:hypothetical protein